MFVKTCELGDKVSQRLGERGWGRRSEAGKFIVSKRWYLVLDFCHIWYVRQYRVFNLYIIFNRLCLFGCSLRVRVEAPLNPEIIIFYNNMRNSCVFLSTQLYTL